MAKVGERGECGESVGACVRIISCEGVYEMFGHQTVYAECKKKFLFEILYEIFFQNLNLFLNGKEVVEGNFRL